MKITTRLNLFALAAILVMTAAIVFAAKSFLEADLMHSRVRLMEGKLENATQSIRQQLNRSGVVAAGKEAEAQWQRLRAEEGFATATLFIVEHTDSRIVYHPEAVAGKRAGYALVDEMLRR